MLKAIEFDYFYPKISLFKLLNDNNYNCYIYNIKNNILYSKNQKTLIYNRREIIKDKKIGFKIYIDKNVIEYLEKYVISIYHKIKIFKPNYIILNVDFDKYIYNQEELFYIIQHLNILLDFFVNNNIELVLTANEKNIKIIAFIINSLKYTDRTYIYLDSNKNIQNNYLYSIVYELNIKDKILFTNNNTFLDKAIYFVEKKTTTFK